MDRVDGRVELSARAVESVALAVPRRDGIEAELRDAEAAERRGYFLPDEDERVRLVFARYLSARAVLLEAIDAMQPLYDELEDDGDEGWRQCLSAFVVGFTAAAILVRMGSYIVDLAGKRKVVSRKLDEAESRYGIPRKSFTEVYQKLGSTRRMWKFHEALLFCEVHRQDIEALSGDPVLGGLVAVLRREESFLQYRKRDYIQRKLDYSVHSFKRRNASGFKKVMFQMFKMSGSTIAEIRQPFVKSPGQGKRVTAEVQEMISPLLHPGDVFVTRHDDALSNLFLPGFWPHAALYIGEANQRDSMGVTGPAEREAVANQNGICFLEAKKDGVLFRPMHDTLRVDAFMVLRPQLPAADVAKALSRAMTHAGKLYDFSFDFCEADRLACTELVYRGYHGVGEMAFELMRHSGRSCLSAEDFIGQALGAGMFIKVLDYGVVDDVVRVF